MIPHIVWRAMTLFACVDDWLRVWALKGGRGRGDSLSQSCHVCTQLRLLVPPLLSCRERDNHCLHARRYHLSKLFKKKKKKKKSHYVSFCGSCSPCHLSLGSSCSDLGPLTSSLSSYKCRENISPQESRASNLDRVRNTGPLFPLQNKNDSHRKSGAAGCFS